MILVFDTYLSDKSLYPDKKLEKLLNSVRDNAYNYRFQSKDLIFLYTVLSYQNYPWKKIFINFEADPNFNTDEIKNRIKLELPNAFINIKRSSTGNEFSNFFKSISNENDWVFFSPNNDHPFTGPEIKKLDYLIKAAEKAEKKYNRNVSIYYSHFTETLNMINKKSYLYFYNGNKFKILDEDRHCFIILAYHQPLESMQIMRKSDLIELFKLAGNRRAIRLESLSNYISNSHEKHILIIPKFECCRHYDGYMHTLHNIKNYISANKVPPLFIPDGFFEKKIKLKIGYNIRDDNSIYLNESSINYSFEDKINGADLKINYENIPDSWKSRIERKELCRNYKPDNNQIMKNKLDVLDPWHSIKFNASLLFLYRLLKLILFKFFQNFKKIFKKTKEDH